MRYLIILLLFVACSPRQSIKEFTLKEDSCWTQVDTFVTFEYSYKVNDEWITAKSDKETRWADYCKPLTTEGFHITTKHGLLQVWDYKNKVFCVPDSVANVKCREYNKAIKFQQDYISAEKRKQEIKRNFKLIKCK